MQIEAVDTDAAGQEQSAQAVDPSIDMCANSPQRTTRDLDPSNIANATASQPLGQADKETCMQGKFSERHVVKAAPAGGI